MASSNAILQNSLYVGNIVIAMLYGVELVLYFASIMLILKGRRSGDSSDRISLYLGTSLLSLITIFFIVKAMFGQEMWIVNENYPGGIVRYYADHGAVWYQTLGVASSVGVCLICDAFLIYRTYIVWNGNWRAIVFPSLMYFGCAALGIALCYFFSNPSNDILSGLSAHIELSLSAVSFGLEITCTMLICGRILWAAKNLERTLGREVSRVYTGAASLLIESMLPYTISGIVDIVTLSIGHPTSNLFLSIYFMLARISSQMIILRVLMGRGWAKDTVSRFDSGVRVLHKTSRSGTMGESSLTCEGSETAINFRKLSEVDGSFGAISTGSIV